MPGLVNQTLMRNRTQLNFNFRVLVNKGSINEGLIVQSRIRATCRCKKRGAREFQNPLKDTKILIFGRRLKCFEELPINTLFCHHIVFGSIPDT